MGLWNAYFLAKFYFYYEGYIRLDGFLNLVFAAFLILPLPGKLRSSRPLAALKFLLAAAFAAALLWHDSWLRPPLESFSFLEEEGMPSRQYIYSFLLGYFNLWDIIVLAFILAACVAAKKFRVRIGPFVVIALVFIIPFNRVGRGDGGRMDRALGGFYANESKRAVRFESVNNPDFDIVILHVCSLSWDDLKESGARNEWGESFFKKFDYLFTAFNSATTYSGPAVIRLMRSNCGQARHGDLYNEAPLDCYLFDSLGNAGFDVDFALNHNGEYGGFVKDARRLGHMKSPLMSQEGLTAGYNMFDDSPVYGDYPVLERWWKEREAKAASPGVKPAALYYNTVTLHDGTHRAGEKNWWNRDRRAQYRERLAGLLNDMTRFIGLLESSGRNVVVVFVPEHGFALNGSRIQAPGLRDIPLPEITLVPVGVKFIGKKYNEVPPDRNGGGGQGGRPQKVISRPASYFALSFMLSEFLAESPFQARAKSEDFVKSLPETGFVSGTQGVEIIKDGNAYYLYGKDKTWIKLPAKD